MNKKGFTLIELLAVIVILAIIAVITVPMIMNVIDKAKIGALEDSAYGMIESANLYYSENVQNISENTIFDFVEGKQTSETKLKYSGNVDNGKLILTSSGKVVVCIDDGTNYAYKELNDTKVTSGKGTCSYNGDTGNFEIISSIDSLNQELNDLKKIGNALSSDILEGKTALVGGVEVTGTMKNNSNSTVTATEVTSDTTKNYIKIPEGYYDDKSLIESEKNSKDSSSILTETKLLIKSIDWHNQSSGSYTITENGSYLIQYSIYAQTINSSVGANIYLNDISLVRRDNTTGNGVFGNIPLSLKNGDIIKYSKSGNTSSTSNTYINIYKVG